MLRRGNFPCIRDEMIAKVSLSVCSIANTTLDAQIVVIPREEMIATDSIRRKYNHKKG